MPTMKNFFGKRVLLIVTGASRGLGAEITNQFSSKVAEGSEIILMARNTKLLEENRKNLETKFPEISFDCFVCDNENTSYEEFDKLLKNHLKNSPEAVVVVHNSGSIGDVDRPLKAHTDAVSIDAYFEVNVRHPMLLSSAVLNNAKVPIFLLNISSLCGVSPTHGLGLYCTQKAARKMYFSCLAEENPEVQILQYSPGPLETDMMTQLRKSAQERVSAMAEGFKEKGTLLTTQQTTLKLCDIIEKANYKSGDHVDYYDR